MDTFIYIITIFCLAIIVIIQQIRFKKQKQSSIAENNSDGPRWKSIIDPKKSHTLAVEPPSKEISTEETMRALAFQTTMMNVSGKVTMWNFNINDQKLTYITQELDNQFKGIDLQEYLEMIHPDDIKEFEDGLYALLKGESEKWDVTYRLIVNENEIRWYEISGLVYSRDKEGFPLIVSGLRWDITTSMNEKLQLEESNVILALTFEAGNIVPWAFDMQTGILSSNNKNSTFYNQKYTANDFVDRFSQDSYKTIFQNEIENILTHKQETLDITIPFQYDGKYEWAHLVGKSMKMSDGTYKFIGTRQFITKEIEKQEELIDLRHKADESNRLKSAFLANMSHEIRTPLNAIVGFSYLIAENNDNEENREFIKIIENNNNLLLRLIEDILDISKIEAGQMKFVFSDIDIPEMIEELRQMYSYRIPSGVDFICNIPDKQLIIRSERNRFMQVICNFINNSIKYTATGSITFGYEHISEGLRFYVRDTGKGISEENLPKVFERFSKFDAFVSGTGLGLSICQTIITKLGGTIGVSSKLGEGSEFWFIIPKE